MTMQLDSTLQRIQPTNGYYRQPNGWITVSPATQTDQEKYTREGWTYLRQYGRFDMPGEYAANHPLETLFMQGGAGELSVEQILTTGLYLNPPMVPTCQMPLTQYHKSHNYSCWQGSKPVVFSQLEGVDPALIGPFPCRFCERQSPTTKARDQHEGVAHKEERGNIRTGQTLAASLVEGMKPAQDPAVAMLMQELMRMRSEMEAMKAAPASAPAPVQRRPRGPNKIPRGTARTPYVSAPEPMMETEGD